VRAELLAPLTDADSPLRDAGLQDIQEDDRQDEFLGALAALGGSAGNGHSRTYPTLLQPFQLLYTRSWEPMSIVMSVRLSIRTFSVMR
jgi:hypothetical protein